MVFQQTEWNASSALPWSGRMVLQTGADIGTIYVIAISLMKWDRVPVLFFWRLGQRQLKNSTCGCGIRTAPQVNSRPSDAKDINHRLI
jgi:hypothetical protein